MATKKKEIDVMDSVTESIEKSGTFNPLLNALRENDKKHLFKTNVTTVFHKTGYPLFDYYFGSVVNVHDEYGKIIKQDPRVGQAAGTFNLIIGNSGSGKAQPNTTVIPTPTGYKQLGDIKIGDYVFTETGEPTKVDGVFPQGEKEVYTFVFTDERSTTSVAEHLWDIYVEDENGRLERKTVDTKYIITEYCKVGDEIPKKIRFPRLSGHVQHQERFQPIDPYIMGVLLGGMDYSDTNLSIICHDGNVLYNFCKRVGLSAVAKDDEVFHYKLYSTTTSSEFLSGIPRRVYFESIPEMITFSHTNNYIPERYHFASYKQQLELIRGLMDVNGSIVYENGQYEVRFTSRSVSMLNSVTDIIRSFGYDTTYISDDTIRLDVPNAFKPSLFTTVANVSLLSWYIDMPDTIDFKYMYIKEITRCDNAVPCTCIHVEHPSHMYVTNDYILTHNTTLAAQISANIIRQYKYANVIHYDCENRFDISRCETITHLPSHYFDGSNGPERYMIKTGTVGLDIIQEMIVKTYVSKMKLKNELMVDSGYVDEFGKKVMIHEPTIIIIDSMTSVINETFNFESNKEVSDAEKMRGNTEGARDAKTMKGFFKDVLPLCKEANIIIYGINHINSNMSMNAFLPVAKQQNYLKQDESIPGGKTMIYYPFNIIKLVAKPSDDFTEEADGFAGHIVMVEPIKSSSNQSGNNSKGVSFEMVFSFKYGFDPLRTMIMYGKEIGAIEGNKNRMKFKDDDSFTFSFKNIMKEKNEKPIWECLRKYVFPHLNTHLSFIEPAEVEFDQDTLNY